MSDESRPDSHDSPEMGSTTTNAAAQPSFQIGNILKLIIPFAIVLGAAYVFFGMFDGMKWFSDLAFPARVPVAGQVLFNGEPLGGALVFTKPTQPGLRGASATTDEDGRFQLATEINGDFLDGAYVGEHLVKVEKRYNVMAFGVAPLMTPDKFASFDTSSLRIEVASEGATDLKIALEGEPNPAPPPGPPGGLQQRRPDNAPPADGPEPTPSQPEQDEAASEAETAAP